jgi:hypothetical protein
VLAGCIDTHRVSVENFTADAPATFTYDAWTNTVMTLSDDGGLARISQRVDFRVTDQEARGEPPKKVTV